jgi:hypothetical protein
MRQAESEEDITMTKNRPEGKRSLGRNRHRREDDLSLS